MSKFGKALQRTYTSPNTLEALLQDKDFQVRETAVSNQNSPLSKIYELLNDKHEDVRKAAKLRLQSEQLTTYNLKK